MEKLLRMKIISAVIFLFVVTTLVNGATLIPSKLDPKFAEAREKIFIPWSKPDESSGYWKKLAGTHVPIYDDFKEGNLSRDLYIPNPGIGYWVLGGLSETAFWKTQFEKIKIGDELISASVHTNDHGIPIYWALWAPKERSYLLKQKMNELGITPASIKYSEVDKLRLFSQGLEPFSPLIIFIAALGLIFFQFCILILLGVLLLRSRTSSSELPLT